MTGPIPFRYIGNGIRPSQMSNGSEINNQYTQAGERISQPKFNSALLALTSGRIAQQQEVSIQSDAVSKCSCNYR